jgi:hypothetical protein
VISVGIMILMPTLPVDIREMDAAENTNALATPETFVVTFTVNTRNRRNHDHHPPLFRDAAEKD